MNTVKTLQRRWSVIKDRCYNPGATSYPHYGARGIGMCSAWRHDSAAFVKWATENGFAPGLQIDRRNPNKDYSPENCRWVTADENKRNRRVTPKWLAAIGRANRKAVVCVETGTQYLSARLAEQHTGASASLISHVLRGVKQTAGGFHWKRA